MAGGAWEATNLPKLPGFYMNFKSAGLAAVETGDRGTVVLPIKAHWGLLILKKDHTQEPDSNFVQETLDLPISLKIAACGMSTSNVLINTYCYIHSTLPTLTIGRNPYNTDTKHYYLIVGK